MRNFRNLEVWKEGIELCKSVYQLTANFPHSEKYSLCQQIERCAVSIPSNIAEGSSRDSSKEFSRFIQIAMGSAFELETQLIISYNNKYCNESNFNLILEKLILIQKKLNALNKAILKNSR